MIASGGALFDWGRLVRGNGQLPIVVTKCISTSNKCLTSSNKKLVETISC